MGIRNDGGRLPLESSPDNSVTAPVSAGLADTVPVHDCGPVNPGGLLDRVVTVLVDDEEGPGAGVEVERDVVGASAAPPDLATAWWAGRWAAGAAWWLTGVADGLPGCAVVVGAAGVAVVVDVVDAE